MREEQSDKDLIMSPIEGFEFHTPRRCAAFHPRRVASAVPVIGARHPS
jgi:hypothetical protein